MDKKEFNRFIEYLNQGHVVFGPVYDDDNRLVIREIEDVLDLNLTGEIPEYSYRQYLIPYRQTVLAYQKNKHRQTKESMPPQALVGMPVVDLKAVNLYDHVFEKDPLYQARRQNTLLLGQSPLLGQDRDYQFIRESFEEEVLEHIPFDIFFQKGDRSFHVFTGSDKGRSVMDKFGFDDYENIKYAGPIKESGMESLVLRLRDTMKDKHNPRLWEKLGQSCLDCGKCSMVCPTTNTSLLYFLAALIMP